MNFIFDMDGVLINSNAAHLKSWKRIADQDGVEFTNEIFWKTFGKTSESIVENYWGSAPLSPEQIADVVERKETAFRESVRDLVKPIDGALDFVGLLAARGDKLALGSSAPRINAEYVLELFGFKQFFEERIVAGDEVLQGKPAPDIFLEAAKKLGEPPERCVVIDDSRSGVKAGRRAGAIVIGFFSEGHVEEEYEDANYVVKSFDEIKSLFKL